MSSSTTDPVPRHEVVTMLLRQQTTNDRFTVTIPWCEMDPGSLSCDPQWGRAFEPTQPDTFSPQGKEILERAFNKDPEISKSGQPVYWVVIEAKLNNRN